MADKNHYHQKLEYGCFYHIYNRTIDKQPMFKSDDNYVFFLRQYDKYLTPYTETYGYCLLGNHFHILLKVRDENAINIPFEDKSCHDLIGHQLQKFFQSYAMAFNKQHQRVGSLFQKPFKRTLISDDDNLSRILFYIHANPQKHGLTDDFRNWKWSSYNRILKSNASHLCKAEVLEWFGGNEHYVQFHDENRVLISQI